VFVKCALEIVTRLSHWGMATPRYNPLRLLYMASKKVDPKKRVSDKQLDKAKKIIKKSNPLKKVYGFK
jgi:hypothetical protein